MFGWGSARTALDGEITALGATRVLLIASGAEEKLARELAAPLGDRVAGVFSDVRPHVPVAVAQAARALAAQTGADALLSVGGGSTTGTAKAVALTTGLPIIAVPTTYAGSEVTPVWGLTEGGRKTTGTDPRVLPEVVDLRPGAHRRPCRADLSAASGLNAMAHCVEAFWAPGATRQLAGRRGGHPRAGRGAARVVADGAGLDARVGPALRRLPGRARAFAGRGLGTAPQDLPRARRQLRPAARPDARHRAAARPGVQCAGGAGGGGAHRPRAGVATPAGGLREPGAAARHPGGLRDIGHARGPVDEAAELVERGRAGGQPAARGRGSPAPLLRAAWSRSQPRW